VRAEGNESWVSAPLVPEEPLPPVWHTGADEISYAMR
jgi:hypothetical protein